MTHEAIFQHGGNLYATMRQQNVTMEYLLDFSANINPLGLPESVRQAIQAAVAAIIHYPDGEGLALKAAISQHYGVEQKGIALGNGATELIYVLCHMLRPKRVLVLAPSFSEYERAARAVVAAVAYSFLDPGQGFAIDVKDVLAQIPKVDLVFLCNPNNPTGQLLPQNLVEEIIAVAAVAQVVVVVDESFLEFSPDWDQHSCRKFLAQQPNLITLHSLTKFYAIPGLRLGFMLADQAIVQLVDQGKDTWNVNSLAQVAGVAALADAAYRQASVTTMTGAKAEFFAELQLIPGFTPFPPSANFICVHIGASGYTARQLGQQLLKQGILIRDCSNFPGLSDEYIRLAVKLPQQNQQLLAAFQEIDKGRDRF
jgi:threonine-phosphate decarboxylase